MNKRAIIILSLCALFLFYKYIAQLYPSLIGFELMHTYQYDAVMLAIMASSYYYSYTFMQIAAGFIIDRFEVRLPMFLAIFLISLMIILFTHTQNFYLMCISRACMGIGASFATVLYMKCAATYTTHKTFGLISSFLATATMLGAACGGAPVAFLFHEFGWQQGLNFVAGIGFIMAFMVLIFNKNTAQKAEPTHRIKFASIKEVLVKKDNWLLLIYSGLTFSPVAILGGLWGTPFMMTKFHLSAANASFFLSVMFIGHAIGSPIWAILSVKLNCKKILMQMANMLAFVAILAILYGHFSYKSTMCLYFIFGFAVGCFMLSFEICRDLNALYIMGLAVAFINTGEGIVGSILEPFIGYILEVSKTGSDFSLGNFQLALTILPCCFLLSSLTLFFLKRESQHVIEHPAENMVSLLKD